jgi:hypothetical protein
MMNRGVRRGLRRRGVQRAVTVVGALLLGWLVVCLLVVVHPTVNQPTRADAVMVLGPPTDRLGTARDLLAHGMATNLVISLNSPKQRQANALCESPPAGITVTCFQPSPPTTQGEARQLGRLASQRGWKTVIVVTSKYHVSRARLLMDRCVDGRVEVVAAQEDISPLEWAYQFAYQTGGYLKAALDRDC